MEESEAMADGMESAEGFLGQPDKPKGRHPALKLLIFLVKLSIAAALVYWVAGKNFASLKERLESMDVAWLAVAALAIAVQFALSAARWRMLIVSQGIKMGYFEVLSLTMQGNFFNLVIPGGAVGGDIVKAGMVVSRAEAGKKLGGAMSILVDRMVGLVGLFSLTIAAGAVLYVRLPSANAETFTMLTGLTAMCFAGLLCCVAAFFHDALLKWNPAAFLMELADSFSKGGASKAAEAFRSFRSEWRALLKAFILSVLLIHPMLIVAVAALLRGLLGTAPPLAGTVLGAVFGSSASAIPITPGGIGTRDAVIKAFLVSGGVDAGAATAAPILNTILIVCFFLSGALFFVCDSFGRRMKAK